MVSRKKTRLIYSSTSNFENINCLSFLNPKYIYSYAKKFSKIKSKVGLILESDNEMTSDPKEMANLLNDQYKSVPTQHCKDSSNNQTCTHLNDILISQTDIEKQLVS